MACNRKIKNSMLTQSCEWIQRVTSPVFTLQYSPGRLFGSAGPCCWVSSTKATWDWTGNDRESCPVGHSSTNGKEKDWPRIHTSNLMWLEKIYLKLIVLNKFILSYDHLNTCVITASISPTRETAFCTLLFISSTQMST